MIPLHNKPPTSQHREVAQMNNGRQAGGDDTNIITRSNIFDIMQNTFDCEIEPGLNPESTQSSAAAHSQLTTFYSVSLLYHYRCLAWIFIYCQSLYE